MDRTREGFETFLYASSLNTLEIVYRDNGRLLACAIVDVEPQAASTVYCWYDPDETARAIGVYNILWTSGWCAANGLPYLYLGYYIRDCDKMNYKINFKPCEILDGQGQWMRHER